MNAAFQSAVPNLLALSAAGDVAVLEAARQALARVEQYELPLAVKVDTERMFPAPAWVFAMKGELKSPNWFMGDFRRRKQLRSWWGTRFREAVTRAENVASWSGLEELGRAPACSVPMRMQVVRLVPSVRHFIRDEGNANFSTKQFDDALQDVGLIREDRREWFTAAPVRQDVSPIKVSAYVRGREVEVGLAVVLMMLWPAAWAPPAGEGL